MPFHGKRTIADATTFTPAERAMIVERSEAMKVGLDGLIRESKDGTSQDLIEAMIPVGQDFDSLTKFMAGKIARTIQDALFKPEAQS